MLETYRSRWYGPELAGDLSVDLRVQVARFAPTGGVVESAVAWLYHWLGKFTPYTRAGFHSWRDPGERFVERFVLTIEVADGRTMEGTLHVMDQIRVAEFKGEGRSCTLPSPPDESWRARPSLL